MDRQGSVCPFPHLRCLDNHAPRTSPSPAKVLLHLCVPVITSEYWDSQTHETLSILNMMFQEYAESFQLNYSGLSLLRRLIYPNTAYYDSFHYPNH